MLSAIYVSDTPSTHPSDVLSVCCGPKAHFSRINSYTPSSTTRRSSTVDAQGTARTTQRSASLYRSTSAYGDSHTYRSGSTYGGRNRSPSVGIYDRTRYRSPSVSSYGRSTYGRQDTSSGDTTGRYSRQSSYDYDTSGAYDRQSSYDSSSRYGRQSSYDTGTSSRYGRQSSYDTSSRYARQRSPSSTRTVTRTTYSSPSRELYSSSLVHCTLLLPIYLLFTLLYVTHEFECMMRLRIHTFTFCALPNHMS